MPKSDESMTKRIFVAETVGSVGEQVRVAGWVQSIRDHSKVIFIDLRDRTGLLQVVCFNPSLIEQVRKDQIGREDVLRIEGTVQKRPDKLVNEHIITGTVELQCEKLVIESKAAIPPFEIEDGIEVDEEIRMKFRYMDLRRPEMYERLKLRHSITQSMRNWMSEQGFIEIETPMLTKDTPEGAREYLVPSRLHPGLGYALPQSPQQFKQLLMVAGFERYFQIAHLMRDEDPRGDRQPEFTQLDLEMSFVEQEDVLQLLERLLSDVVKKSLPHKLVHTPFKRLTYDESMKQYGSDKPDIRENKDDQNELSFVLITDFPLFEKTKDGSITAVHHPFTSWKPTPENDDIMKRVAEGKTVRDEELLSLRANCYDVVLNGVELGSGSIRIHDPHKQQAIFSALGLTPEEIDERFGHMLQAFGYGCPPHGGFAFGFDRLIMLLLGLPNIREVIAFPKTGDGRDLMMGAPAPLSDDKLKELHLKKIS